MTRFMVTPIWAGELVTVTPAPSSAAILSDARPLPPAHQSTVHTSSERYGTGHSDSDWSQPREIPSKALRTTPYHPGCHTRPQLQGSAGRSLRHLKPATIRESSKQSLEHMPRQHRASQVQGAVVMAHAEAWRA